MPPETFVDTWFLIALTDPRDSNHKRAVAIHDRYRHANLVTSDAVLMELLSFFADEPMLRAVATETARKFQRESTCIPADRPLFLRGLKMYEERFDKQYSLVDCMSMMIMRDRGITHVLSNDHHFSQEGFTLVNA